MLLLLLWGCFGSVLPKSVGSEEIIWKRLKSIIHLRVAFTSKHFSTQNKERKFSTFFWCWGPLAKPSAAQHGRAGRFGPQCSPTRGTWDVRLQPWMRRAAWGGGPGKSARVCQKGSKNQQVPTRCFDFFQMVFLCGEKCSL